MILTKGLIKADIIAARQAIEYYQEHNEKDIKKLLHIIYSRRLKN